MTAHGKPCDVGCAEDYAEKAGEHCRSMLFFAWRYGRSCTLPTQVDRAKLTAPS